MVKCSVWLVSMLSVYTVRVLQVQVDWTDSQQYVHTAWKMVLLFASGMSQHAAADDYHQHHPGCLLIHFKETGSVQDRHQTGHLCCATSFSSSVDIISKVMASPQCSIWKIAQDCCISSSVYWVF